MGLLVGSAVVAQFVEWFPSASSALIFLQGMEARRAETLPSVAREGQRLGARQPGPRRRRGCSQTYALIRAPTTPLLRFLRHTARYHAVFLQLIKRRRQILLFGFTLARQRVAGGASEHGAAVAVFAQP